MFRSDPTSMVIRILRWDEPCVGMFQQYYHIPEIPVGSGHRREVLCLHVCCGKLFSGSLDKTIIVWNINTDEAPAYFNFPLFGKVSVNTTLTIATTLSEHFGAVTCISSHEHTLFSGDSNGIVLVWDIGEETIPRFRVALDSNCHFPITCVCYYQDYLFFGHRHLGDGVLHMWNLSEVIPVEMPTLTPHGCYISTMQVYNGRLYTGSMDGSVQVHEFRDGSLSLVLALINPGKLGFVFSMVVISNVVYCGLIGKVVEHIVL